MQINFGSVCNLTVTAAGFTPLHRASVDFKDKAVMQIDFELHPELVTTPQPTVSGIEPASQDATNGKSQKLTPHGWDIGGFFEGGPGLEQRTNYSFVMAGVQAGKILTPELGHGLLKGNFEYGVQVIPYWESFTPKFQHLVDCPAGATSGSQCYGPVTGGGTYHGFSITPFVFRWNFTSGHRFMPWAQAAGGLLYTTRKYPGVGNLDYTDPTQTGPNADTSVWNFLPQGGVGAHYFVRDNRSIDFGLNGTHLSSASLGDKNPGVNVSLIMSIGYTWWK